MLMHRFSTLNILVPGHYILPQLICLSLLFLVWPWNIPDRRQWKTLSTFDKRKSKIDRSSVFDCHLLTVGDKWQSKTLFLLIFDLHSSKVLAFLIASNKIINENGQPPVDCETGKK